jgi:hypothetical protein
LPATEKSQRKLHTYHCARCVARAQLAIYDSRVGTALKTLKHEDERIIKCPSGRRRPGDACTHEQWAENYEKFIWILEVIRKLLNERGHPFSIADVEMALYMMGK